MNCFDSSFILPCLLSCLFIGLVAILVQLVIKVLHSDNLTTKAKIEAYEVDIENLEEDDTLYLCHGCKGVFEVGKMNFKCSCCLETGYKYGLCQTCQFLLVEEYKIQPRSPRHHQLRKIHNYTTEWKVYKKGLSLLQKGGYQFVEEIKNDTNFINLRQSFSNGGGTVKIARFKGKKCTCC